MKLDKVVDSKMWGVTTQNSDVFLPVGDSASGTFTKRINPLRGTLLWDRGMLVLRNVAVAGGATGGSYTITALTDAVRGYTQLPLAVATGVGPNSPASIPMQSLHQSSALPLPTLLHINQTATGGGITLNCNVIAKQYRGTLGTAGGTSERIIQGNMIRGVSSSSDFSGDEGVSADTTFVFGTSGSSLGMHRMRLWDTALFWAVAGQTVAGTHDADVIANVGGASVSVATTGAAGAINAVGEKVALANQFFGQCPNPSGIIWTEVTAGGVSDFRVVMLAKTGRGSMGKR